MYEIKSLYDNKLGDSGPNLAGLSSIFLNPKGYNILPYKHNYTKTGEYVETGFFIPAYTYITFTDRPWTKPNGPFGSEDKEGHVTWSYSSIVTKGTVIIITVSISGGTATANIGGVTAFNIFGISDSGEQIIAFKGDWQNRPIDN